MWKGNTTKVIYRKNGKGEDVKVTQTYMHTTRRFIEPFGDAASGNKSVTIRSKECINIMPVDVYNQLAAQSNTVSVTSAAKAWAPKRRLSSITEDSPPVKNTIANPGIYKPPRREHTNRHQAFSVKVGNIDESITQSEFEDILFCDICIRPNRIKLIMNHGEKRHVSKGFAFLDFRNDEERQSAIAVLDGHIVNYQVLSAEEALPLKKIDF